jgi:long-subunit acyl-CoA synthetase (AMP-forming)
MKGYFNNKEADRKAFAHGWFNTGLTGLSQIGPERVRSFFATIS